MFTPLAVARQYLWPQPLPLPASQWQLVAGIQERAARLRSAPDALLRMRTAELRSLVEGGLAILDTQVLLPAMALVCESARRALSIELFDVQLAAALAMLRGSIAEMQTGEGKTYAAMPVAAVHALEGRGVHVLTPNSYLAQRDYDHTAGVFRLLGISSGLVREQVPLVDKRRAYACDVTYATGYEVGFDYLRDQLAILGRRKHALGEAYRRKLRGLSDQPPAVCQRGHALAILDEVDCVLLDEACLPLVLSNPLHSPPTACEAYQLALDVAAGLREGTEYLLDRSRGTVRLSEAGLAALDRMVPSLGGELLLRPWSAYVQQALRARLLLERDVDYVVQHDKILIVDEFTGRVFQERSWRDGLQQMLEVKEGLPLTAEQSHAVSISRQRYFRMYDKLCGMTGTASESQRELWRLYRLPIAVVPPRLACRRLELATRFFANAQSKYRAIVDEIEREHRTGRPVLVGSRTIAASEMVASLLARRGLPLRLLNGKQDADEARIVAEAGQPRTITVATNMAGRGTDIRLARGVAALGGLHLVATERQLSSRVDRQLAGRVARQGEPGSARFFVAADDPLIADHAPALAARLRTSAGEDGEAYGDFDRDVLAAQRRVESAAYDERRKLLAYDRWLDEVIDRLASEH